jgi:hypothetical protein
MATKANITIDQGTTFNTEIVLTDEENNPLDLSGYTGLAQMRKSYTSSTYKSFVVTLSEGIVLLPMNSSNSSSLTAGRYVYDVLLTDSLNNVNRIIEGIVTVTPRVSV